MSWRNLAYGSQQAAEAAPAVVPSKAPVKETVVSQGAVSAPLRVCRLARSPLTTLALASCS